MRDLPDEIHERLKQRAEAHRRSMNQEAVTILEAVLGDRAGPPPLEALDDFRIQGSAPLTDAVLREARERGRP